MMATLVYQIWLRWSIVLCHHCVKANRRAIIYKHIVVINHVVVSAKVTRTISLCKWSYTPINVIWTVNYKIIHDGPVVKALNKLLVLNVIIAFCEELKRRKCSKEWDSNTVINQTRYNNGKWLCHLFLDKIYWNTWNEMYHINQIYSRPIQFFSWSF